jgi:hypothetical protein
VSTSARKRFVAAALAGAVAGFHALAAQAQVPAPAPAPAQTRARAQQLEYGLTAGYGHSDNVFRRSDDEISSDILTAGLELNWQEDRTRIDADVRADLDYNHYLNVDDSFDVDDQITGNANGHVTLGIVPEHFTWLIEDSFGQTQQDPLLPASPETLESINYLTTGPDFTLLIGSNNLMRFSGRYSATTYETSPFDSTRAGGGLTFLRQMSDRSSLSFNVDANDVDYDDPASVDFTNESASFNYTLEAARTDIDATLGYSRMDIDDGSEKKGPLVDIEIQRQVSNSSRLNLQFGTRLSDSAEALRDSLSSEDFGGGSGSSDGSGVIATATTFENKFASLGWQFDRPRTTFDISAGWDKDVYESVDDLDRERLMLEAGAQRHLNSRLDARLRVAYSEESYQIDDSETEEWRLTLGGSWRFGRDTGVELWGERLKRDSNTTAGGGNSVENRIFLTFFYRPAAR